MEETQFTKIIAYETEITVNKKVDSVIKNSDQKLVISLAHLELFPNQANSFLKISKVEEFAKQLVIGRLDKLGSSLKIKEILSQFFIVSDISKFASELIGKVNQVSQTK